MDWTYSMVLNTNITSNRNKAELLETKVYTIIRQKWVRCCGVVCGQYFDYVVRVLMPEMLVKIVMQIYSVGHDEAEEMLLAEPPDSSDADWYEALMMMMMMSFMLSCSV